MVDLVNSSVKDKHDRNYAPLTDAQKKDMTTDQIKTWEEKQKKESYSVIQICLA